MSRRKARLDRARDFLDGPILEEIIHPSGTRAVAYACPDCKGGTKVNPITGCDECTDGKTWRLKAR